MSICEFGFETRQNNLTEKIDHAILPPPSHPLLQLEQAIGWEALKALSLPDLQKSTAKGCWWRGRKLKLRTHLSVFVLQRLLKKTDRQMERDLKRNAVYQGFCGQGVVPQWKCPDHTKIARFRSRLSLETKNHIMTEVKKQAAQCGVQEK